MMIWDSNFWNIWVSKKAFLVYYNQVNTSRIYCWKQVGLFIKLSILNAFINTSRFLLLTVKLKCPIKITFSYWWWFVKTNTEPFFLVSESKHMSILFVINSCTAPILFLKEFTFSAPIVTFLAFCNLCAVTDGKTSCSSLSSAVLFLLKDLLLSTVGLTGLSVLELFTLKTKFLFTLFYIADSSFFPFCFLRPCRFLPAKHSYYSKSCLKDACYHFHPNEFHFCSTYPN